jgi:hypothetical protein
MINSQNKLFVVETNITFSTKKSFVWKKRTTFRIY